MNRRFFGIAVLVAVLVLATVLFYLTLSERGEPTTPPVAAEPPTPKPEADLPVERPLDDPTKGTEKRIARAEALSAADGRSDRRTGSEDASPVGTTSEEDTVSRSDENKGYFYLPTGQYPPDYDEKAPDGGPKYAETHYPIGYSLFLERGKQYRILKEWFRPATRPPMTPEESARHKALSQRLGELEAAGAPDDERYAVLQELIRLGSGRLPVASKSDGIEWNRLKGQTAPSNAEPILVDLRGIDLYAGGY